MSTWDEINNKLGKLKEKKSGIAAAFAKALEQETHAGQLDELLKDIRAIDKEIHVAWEALEACTHHDELQGLIYTMEILKEQAERTDIEAPQYRDTALKKNIAAAAVVLIKALSEEVYDMEGKINDYTKNSQ